MKKRLLSLVLAFALVLGVLPAGAFATDGTEDAVEVYLSVSLDDEFAVGNDEDATVMALKEIEVPYFDLALYGLSDFYYNPDCYAAGGGFENMGNQTPGTSDQYEGVVTMLHLLIYATEVYYCGIDPENAGQGYLYNEGLLGGEALSFSGSTGSVYFGSFWGQMGGNLNYFLNYAAPLGCEGWGATADQVKLETGDVVSLGCFSDWGFYYDPDAGFRYFLVDGSSEEDGIAAVTVTKGEQVELELNRSYADMSNMTTIGPFAIAEEEVFMTTAESVVEGAVGGEGWTSLGTTDENACITVDTADLEVGTYYICVQGYGQVSAPGGILLTVAEPETHTVSWETSEDYTITGETTVAGGEDYVFTLDMTVGLRPALVTANGKELTGINRKYKVENVTEDLTITVEAEEVELKPVTVWSEVTLGTGSIYQGGENNHLFNLQQVTVPYFDLALYDLEEFYYNPDCYAEGSYDDGDLGGSRANQKPGTQATAYGVVTTMHLYIYMTEVLFCGLDPEDAGKGYLEAQGLIGADVNRDYDNFDNCLLYYTGTFGSTFMYLWNHGSNLNYYINYAYPLGAEGWGSTADQQALKDGDIISSHLIESSYAAMSNYQFFVVNDEDGKYTFGEDQIGYADVKVGDSLDLTLFTCVTTYGEPTSHEPVEPCEVYFWTDDEHLNGHICDDDGEWFYGIGEAWVEYENDAPFPFACDSFYGEGDEYEGIYAEDGTFTITATQPGTYYIAALGSDDFNGEAGAAVFRLTVECNHQGGIATCQEKAVCEVCFESYGELGDHSVDTENWIAENGEHFHKCTVTGCDYKEDRDDCSGGTATCQEKAVCEVCLEPYGKLADHVYDQSVIHADYLAAEATCTADALYHKSCACGQAGTETFAHEDTALGHSWDKGTVTLAPTYADFGVKTFTCQTCGDTKTEQIAKLKPITPVGPKPSEEEPEEKPTQPEVTVPTYSDVKDEWYAPGVEYVTANGLMTGIGGGKFGPDVETTRGMIVTVLWRLAGQPVPKNMKQFTDVAVGTYCDQAVAWAAEQGIVTGYAGTDCFGPSDSITREQLAVILYRYAGSPAVQGDLSAFADAGKVSDYAVDAMIWATQQGIITGLGDGSLAPQGKAARGQVASMLMRLLDK